ncbi:MAG: SUMF1/EgtB/PvdO family nonheme iron enzyme [Planctomycetaceae bacterium]|jgi:formylglycine-generating enzyme required for sulfatase activity|nr:SUMF1/EgtB/PvdO family nonheme iron enzyme [Planctomycetaceae bacterium]
MRSVFFAVLCCITVPAFGYDNGIVPVNTPESAKRLITDLIKTYGNKYPKGSEFLKQLENIDPNNQTKLDALIREAALANPLLDFDKILCIRRKTHEKGSAGFSLLNAYTEDTIPRKGWDNEVILLSNLRTEPKMTTVYRHHNDGILRDIELHFDANKLLFASVNDKGNWAVFEAYLDSKNLRELTPNDQNDIQWFDPCYLAEEGAILSFSTAGMQGVPCVAGSQKVASLYRIDEAKENQKQKIRQLTFEQDSGWHPRLLNDGRVMYLRWQYTETPHYFDRMLFTMAPDGRQQRALWGSGAFFPTAYKFARPVPTHPSMVLGIVSGHHSLPETGRLMLVDPNIGTHYPFRHDPKTKEWGVPGTHADIYPRIYPKEVTGCVQEIPGWGRDVIGNVYDNQGGDCKYTFATPFPLNEKYFFVSMQLNHKGTWGIWLVDVFDNMVKVYDLPDAGLYEPIPLIPRERPPVRPDLTVSGEKEGVMFITNVNDGRGLKGIPQNKAKSLRIFAYHWAYWGTGNYTAMGEYSGYDIKRILGTVPIEEDGSVAFKVPANTPVAFHLLDEDGAAIQIMQSWTIAMPGENVSCVGCHEKTNDVVPPKNAIASRKPPQEITPFYGAARPFGFQTEIQPVLDRYCVQCHNDTNKKAAGILSFSADDNQRNPVSRWQDNTPYLSLHPFIRRPGTESDIAAKTPMDYHVSTSELIQRLRRGHYGVQLDKEARDKLYTWIDLNVPYRAAWNSPKNEARRLELQKLYAGLDDDPEEEFRSLYNNAVKDVPGQEIKPVPPEEINKLLKHNDDGSKQFRASIGPLPAVKGDNVKAQGFPFAYTEAKRRQNGLQREPMTVNGIKFVPIPAGEFVMGSIDGFDDERPRAAVKIEKPFWIAETEITNAQYAPFDPEHDTGYEGEHGYDHISPGYIANHPDQPVARVSWQEAAAFCDWLTKKIGEPEVQRSETSGLKVMLPTEAQWEWASRAGTDQAFFFGHRFADFSYYANLADAGLRKTNQSHEGSEWDGHDRRRPPNFLAQAGSSLIKHRRYFPAESLFPLRDDRFTDKWFTVDYVKQYAANPWGLYDVIGNVWEWTQSDYAPYPYNGNDGRNDGNLTKKKAVRGGSHADRPKVIGSAVRIPYETYQKVHNVGFRPIIVTE